MRGRCTEKLILPTVHRNVEPTTQGQIGGKGQVEKNLISERIMTKLKGKEEKITTNHSA